MNQALPNDKPSPRRILWLRERFAFMGAHSGYDLVCEAIARQWDGTPCSVFRQRRIRSKYARHFLRKLARRASPSPFYDPSSVVAELKGIGNLLTRRCDIVHITYVEENLGLLRTWGKRRGTKRIGTLHQPADWWRDNDMPVDFIKPLDAAIVLRAMDIPFFEQVLPGRVHFIPHGIDTDFFRPAASECRAPGSPPRFVFCGTWLRDLETFGQVLDWILAHHLDVWFDLVVPERKRNHPVFDRLGGCDRVVWHANLSDEQLRDLYGHATALLLPMLDCTANNAVLEAMACGLPIISNAAGGLLDYTRPAFADLLPSSDVDGMVDAVERALSNPEAWRARGRLAREFCENDLAWPIVGQKTLALYQAV